MACSIVKTPLGHVIICGPKRVKACAHCGSISTKLCDYPNGRGKTCDRPICEDCATHVEPDTDLCRNHAFAAKGGKLRL